MWGRRGGGKRGLCYDEGRVCSTTPGLCREHTQKTLHILLHKIEKKSTTVLQPIYTLWRCQVQIQNGGLPVSSHPVLSVIDNSHSCTTLCSSVNLEATFQSLALQLFIRNCLKQTENWYCNMIIDKKVVIVLTWMVTDEFWRKRFEPRWLFMACKVLIACWFLRAAVKLIEQN